MQARGAPPLRSRAHPESATTNRRRRAAPLAAAFAAAALLLACGIPRDPEGTLERVQGGRMRVGILERPPWATLEGGKPSGVEVDLVEGFARSLDAEIDWFPGSEAELFTALEKRELDLAIGGFTDDDPWAQKVTFTQPYAIIEVVVAAPPGRAPPADLSGLQVAARSGTEVPRLVEEAGGIAVRVPDLSKANGLVAGEKWEVRALGLVPGSLVLDESRPAMAVPLGENAWLVRLERHLSEEAPFVDELLGRYAGP
jgi:polar amino acid transport system substrate-binding protein